MTEHLEHNTKEIFANLVGRDRGAGARENREREGYGRRERKGREAEVLRGRELEAGEKCETLFLKKKKMKQRFRILSKTRTQNIFDLHLTSPQSPLRLLSKRANENLRLG